MSVFELPRIEDLDNREIDVFEMERVQRGDSADPYPFIEEMRRKGPVHHIEYRKLFTPMDDAQLSALDHYTVFGYEACAQVIGDPVNFTNREIFQHSLGKSFGQTLTAMDGEEHKRFRKVVQKAFLPNVVARWGETVVQPVVDKLMAKFIKGGRADLVADYAHHVPFQIVYNMLLLDEDQAPIFHRLAVAQLLASQGLAEGPESTAKLGRFFAKYLEQRRGQPGDDLVSHLATVEVDGDRLPDEVLISFLRQLVNAGGDTTYRATSVLLTCLLRHPEQMHAVAQDRRLLGAAVEEALRWDGPILTTFRYCKHDTDVCGTVIPAGSVVDVCLGSANRDPTVFNDPDKFDIFRERQARQLGFAGGPHICVGQHLARVEMLRATEAVLERLKNLRLDPEMPPPDIRGHMMRVPRHLYVRFEPA